MRVRRMPMHLSSGHVTDAGKILPLPSNFPQLDLGRRADSRWALPQISSLFYIIFAWSQCRMFTMERMLFVIVSNCEQLSVQRML